MHLTTRKETPAERARLMATCLPFDCKIVFYERHGSQNKCVYDIRIMSPDAEKAKVVALKEFNRQVTGAGLVIECTSTRVAGKGDVRTLSLTPTTAALFGRKP